MESVHNAGRPGILPKNIAKALPEYKMKQYQVTRRIQRMNKRMAFESGERIFEKRGKKWAFTEFGVEIWGRTEEDREDFLSEEGKDGSQNGD